MLKNTEVKEDKMNEYEMYLFWNDPEDEEEDEDEGGLDNK